MDEAERKRLVIGRESIQARVEELAREISRRYQGQDLVLIGVLNGVFMFFSDLVKRLETPCQVDFVRLASYGASSVSSGEIELVKDIEKEIQGRHVLVVEDIVDTGRSMAFLLERLARRAPASLALCVLIDKKQRRETQVTCDFAGFEVSEGFLVGYGLDYDEKYRYLDEIYHLELE